LALPVNNEGAGLKNDAPQPVIDPREEEKVEIEGNPVAEQE
jgi:hypothetical protein